MPETLWTVLLSGAFGLLTASVVVLLTQRWEKQKHLEDREADLTNAQSEEQRWYGQMFLQRKFDALANLHEALVNCRFSLFNADVESIGETVPGFLDSLKDFERRLRLREAELVRARVVASLYLKGESETIRGAISAFIRVRQSIGHRVSDAIRDYHDGKGGQFQWLTVDEADDFIKGARPAMDFLRGLLAPRFPGSPDESTDTSTDT